MCFIVAWFLAVSDVLEAIKGTVAALAQHAIFDDLSVWRVSGILLVTIAFLSVNALALAVDYQALWTEAAFNASGLLAFDVLGEIHARGLTNWTAWQVLFAVLALHWTLVLVSPLDWNANAVTYFSE